MDKVIVNGFCRCCSSEGPFKGLTTKYNWMGEEEIYSEMLHECFNVLLNNIDLDNRDGICEVCITQLRSAYNFKKQVIQTEDMLKKKCQSQNKEFSDVKLEYEIPLDSEIAADSDNETEFSQPNYADNYEPEYPCKEEPPELRKRKRENEPSTSNVKKNKKTHRRVKESTHAEADEKNIDNLSQQKKQTSNLYLILRFSNVTPFKTRNALGYVCAFCSKSFQDPRDLRTHTHVIHTKEKLVYKMNGRINSLVILLDIEDLKCTICSKNIDDINFLISHLKSTHKKSFFDVENDYFLPFKLTKDELMPCFICKEKFRNMKNIMNHMNCHFRNYICLTCGAGFINRQKLQFHELSHAKKDKVVYPCNYCDRVFKYFSSRRKHFLIDHRGVVGSNVCEFCNERFANYYQKARHMIQKHDFKTNKCEHCEKSYTVRSNLLQHIRSEHLKERKYECDLCPMKFFFRYRLAQHQIVHTREKNFSCEVCGKAVASNRNLRLHMRTHDKKTK